MKTTKNYGCNNLSRNTDNVLNKLFANETPHFMGMATDSGKHTSLHGELEQQKKSVSVKLSTDLGFEWFQFTNKIFKEDNQ